ncbi:Nucleoporin NUP35 [Apodemus speciosus]|uniref:Nucleoporin NUP35 n=1 Tax=Apodemus speciosus TaxID=105296 RepID=A0ABQ0EH90_APOSI
MAAFAVDPQAPPLGSEPMMLGSPTSPKSGVNAQFLPGFLMGDLPAPVTPQPRSISGPSVGVMEMRSPLLAGGSPPQPVVPAHKDKSGAPPVRSIYDDISSPGLGSTPLTSRRQGVTMVSLCSPGCPGTHSVDQAGLKHRNLPASASQVLGLKACTTTAGQTFQCCRALLLDLQLLLLVVPVRFLVFNVQEELAHIECNDCGRVHCGSQEQSLPECPRQSMFSPANIGQPRKTTLSPAQLDPFYTQGDSLTSEDHLDDTWVTVFGNWGQFPQASASYILLQFAQYGNILKHVMSNTGNWMHIRYQSKLQARKALSKDGRIFGESIMIGVKPCIDKNVMENSDRGVLSSPSLAFTPPIRTLGTPAQPGSTPRVSTMRPLATAYKASTSDYQVISDRQTPKKDESLVSRAMEYMFGW